MTRRSLPVRRATLALFLALCASLPGCNFRDSSPAGKAAVSDSGVLQRCAALQGTQLGSGMVTATESVPQGEQLIPFFKRLVLKFVLPFPLPEVRAPRNFCRVTAEVRAVPGSRVTVQAWLPEEWNGKAFAAGGGGYNGGMFGASLALHQAATLGYAGSVNDLGHEQSDSAEFASNREQFIDFGYRANHFAAVFMKDLIAAYYGKPATRAYFVGGSGGGREALMQAQRYPEDYDGVVAGMPSNSWTRLMGLGLWNHQAVQGAPELGTKLAAVQAAVIGKCDALDGVTDQVLENPLLCKFDPAELRCQGADAADCLNEGEVAALRKIYEGPRLRDGTQVFPGPSPGGEGIPNNWDFWMFGDDALQAKLTEESFRWMVYGDPEWSRDRFDLDRDYPKARERAAPITDSDDPDLSGFVAHGGKLIIHHGWLDAAIPAAATVNYYDAIRAKVGPAADRHVRLFMVPGMTHGAGGGVPAPTSYDMLAELDRWVEGAPAPERVIATRYEPDALWHFVDPAAKVVRTRPLCAWPKVARYRGSGSADDQANFECK